MLWSAAALAMSPQEMQERVHMFSDIDQRMCAHQNEAPFLARKFPY
jgi:hypothetical protein